MMEPYYSDEHVTLYHGDCLEVLRSMPDESVHAVVTDPPYGLGFMGREWDALPPGEEWARECLRVLKPGGHLLAFGGSRTWHRLAVAIEGGGFEIRDSIAWLYGSGFPKSLDVSKAIDKAAGAEREVVGIGGKSGKARGSMAGDFAGEWNVTAPTTPDAEQWQGWGTALKPAFEPIVVARKPLTGTVAGNVLAHGTGALNIDGCRVATDERMSYSSSIAQGAVTFGTGTTEQNPAGRWPANVALDDTQAGELDRQSGESVSRANVVSDGRVQVESSSYGVGQGRRDPSNSHTDSGGASRFFPVFRWQAKAPSSERPKVNGVAHPTVKPLNLLRWMVRLVTPPGGTVLDPFAGSGTTLEAALLEGFPSIGIEREDTYLPLIEARISKPLTPVLNLGGIA